MVTTDEQLLSLTHAIKSCPMININKENLVSERGTLSGIMDNPGEWVLLSHIGTGIFTE